MTRIRSWWGWGWDDVQIPRAGVQELGDQLQRRFGMASPGLVEPVAAADVPLPEPAIAPPPALAELLVADHAERLRHAHGQAFRDVVRAVRGQVPRIPDAVLAPREQQEVQAVLDWASDRDVVVVPYGGGTSVVGGVNPPDDPRPVVSLDLTRMDRVREIDPLSLAAEIEGGALGPRIEDQLRPHGLTLRHFPQSWEFSTLGGWVVTRAGGHYATLRTHIDDLVEAVTAVTPRGLWSSRRLPGSGAGPSPDRLLIGSEGTLGIVTSAWVRIQRRPRFRAQATVTFDGFAAGLRAVQALAQSELYPANCRLLDPAEAALTGAGPDGRSVLVLGFESADHPLGPWVERALELCRDHGGVCPEGPRLREGDDTGTAEGGSAAWRQVFLQAPYLRDALVRLGMVVETFETAITWDRAASFVDEVRAAAEQASEEQLGRAIVTARVTHAYPDGCAPYLTVIGPGRAGSEVAQWDAIKAAVSETLLAQGGTITHHHAVGRDHRPWYDRQRPELFAVALRAAKHAVDPAGVCNPGVLLDT